MPLTNEDTENTKRLIARAKEALGSKRGDPEGLLKLAKALKKIQKFNLARRLLALASELPPDPKWERTIVQQHASCTEKDPDLPLDQRYQKALEIIRPVLAEAEAYHQNPTLATPEEIEATITAHQETLGIAGAIHKRWWQVDSQVRHLVHAQELYGKGWDLAQNLPGPGIPDQGYTGINAAFLLDLLAQQIPGDPDLVEERRLEARRIREEIRSRLGALPEEKLSNWWSLVTLAEACFGLSDYAGARRWLEKTAAIRSPPDPWEYETTAKQLAQLAMIQQQGEKSAEKFEASEAWNALRALPGGNRAGLLTAFSGKVGLALSGGGFRASLFHIGVLARLAELDMLRHVEVLSCVSGGSIIGALYYLKLRELLESRPDEDIAHQDYIDLVSGLENAFMTGIERNPRMQVFSKLHLLLQRTEEMAKLLDETLYGPAAGLMSGERPELRCLLVHPPANAAEVKLPRNERTPFAPKYDNWRRAHKIPTLIINATSLNTGHNWQFTASFIGESPNQIVPEVDGNERLRRMYFHEMPERHQAMPLGLAVAASAAVPALFRPVKLAGLYPDRDVELVDGGVHDNQGIGGLLEQDCTVILVSDASGQLVAEPYPSRLESSVLLRSNSTLMSRVRELEYRELRARKEAGLLRDLLFVHLKKDLAVAPVDWLNCDLPKEANETHGVPPDSALQTPYGVRGDVQNLLAGIRTDLDVFSEAEAYALMSSGYRMTSHYFSESIRSFTPNAAKPVPWRFQRVNPFLSEQETPEENRPEAGQVSDFHEKLKLAAQLLFKAPRLLPNFSLLTGFAKAILFSAILALITVVGIAFAVLFWRVPVLLLPLVIGVALIALVIFLFARGGLYWITSRFDQLYLRKGSLTELLRARRR